MTGYIFTGKFFKSYSCTIFPLFELGFCFSLHLPPPAESVVTRPPSFGSVTSSLHICEEGMGGDAPALESKNLSLLLEPKIRDLASKNIARNRG